MPDTPSGAYRVTDHAARPGPLYYDSRCLRCSEAVVDHAPWWWRLLRRFRASCESGEARDV
jgi:hypothetical protein